MSLELAIKDIVVGERSRKEMGDLTALMESIRERGCLHPPAVRQIGTKYHLVAGARRLAAMRKLKFDRVTVTLVRSLTDELSALMAEGEENTCREPFAPSEAVAHAAKIEGVIAAKAKERQGTRTDLQPSANLAQGSPSPLAAIVPALDNMLAGIKTRDAVAKSVGLGRTSLAKAKAVLDAIDDEALPEPVRAAAKEAAVEMDRTGKVDGAHQKVKKAIVENAAITKYLESGGEFDPLAIATWRKHFTDAFKPLTRLPLFDVDEVIAKADAEQLDDLAMFVASLAKWHGQIQAKRPAGLRLVGGDR